MEVVVGEVSGASYFFVVATLYGYLMLLVV